MGKTDDASRLAQIGADVAKAATLLRGGALVAFGTETVYGLGADARNDAAVAQVFAAKGRPASNPLIIHVDCVSRLEGIAELSPQAHEIAGRFWPGPLTMVLPLVAGSGISPLVTAGLSTIAVRVPAHPLARDFLAACACPVAAPSANPSGKLSPTRAQHVAEGLGAHLAYILDGGACAVGLESTIIDVTDEPRLLRPGGISAEDLGIAPLTASIVAAKPSAPGQLLSHYAPRAAVLLNHRGKDGVSHWLGFGPQDAGADANLSRRGDLGEAAQRLFTMLRVLDARGADVIGVSPIPAHGIGLAINDRLKRAAAPRCH